jgi:hypothetical protein
MYLVLLSGLQRLLRPEHILDLVSQALSSARGSGFQGISGTLIFT